MKSVGWALIQYDLYPYKKENFRHRITQTQKEETCEDTQGEDGLGMSVMHL